MGRQFASWTNYVKFQSGMIWSWIFLLTFGSCNGQRGVLPNGPKYQGYEQNIPGAFIANYIYDNAAGTSTWLSAPLVFKLNESRDTLFLYTSGHGYIFPRIKDSMKCFSGHINQKRIKFTILDSSIEAVMPDCRIVRIVNKSMI